MKLISIWTLAATSLSYTFNDVANSPNHFEAVCACNEGGEALRNEIAANSDNTADQILEGCTYISERTGILYADCPYRTATYIQQVTLTANLQAYGCWCNAASGWAQGRGEPVDGIDTVCRNVHHSNACLAAEDCEIDGAWMTFPVMSANGFEFICQNDQLYNDAKDIDCANKRCTIGTHLVSGIMNLFMSGEALNSDNVHQGFEFNQVNPMNGQVVPNTSIPGSFDFEAECVAEPGVREIDCCGPYPFRREYNIRTSECCVEDFVERIRSCGMCMSNELSNPSGC